MDEVMDMFGTDITGIASIAASLIGGMTSYLELKEKSRMHRAEIWAKTRTSRLLMRNRQKSLVSYLDSRFSERKTLLDRYFTLAERALDLCDDDDLLRSALDGIMGVYCSNPADGIDSTILNCSAMNNQEIEE